MNFKKIIKNINNFRDANKFEEMLNALYYDLKIISFKEFSKLLDELYRQKDKIEREKGKTIINRYK